MAPKDKDQQNPDTADESVAGVAEEEQPASPVTALAGEIVEEASVAHVNEDVGEHQVDTAAETNMSNTMGALKATVQAEVEQVVARVDRAVAMASVPQKVIDGNETAALATISGQRPVRDLTEAPPAQPLGPVDGVTA